MKTQTSPKDRHTSFSVTGRRQNRSCDHCRKGKRACNAAPLDISSARPCSNCEKTGKECTFDWLRPSKQTSGGLSTERQKKPTTQRSIDRPSATGGVQVPEGSKVPRPDLSCSDLDYLLQDGFEFLHSPRTLQFDNKDPMSFSSPIAEVSNRYFQSNSAPLWQDSAPSVSTVPSLRTEDSFGQEQFSLDCDIEDNSGGSQLSQTFDDRSSRGEREDIRPGKRRRRSRMTTGSSSRSSFGSNQQRPDNCSSRRWSIISDPSSNSLPQRLASSACTSHISSGLMRVYHDSMENALSCWLNETTCPYNIRSSSQRSVLESMTDEWGPNWSNRICSRVCRLDRAASSTRDRPLTKLEDQAASRALQTVIMSFATQWAQSSQRSAREFSSFSNFERDADGSQSNEFPSGDSPVPIEFDRMMQEMFWHRARQALQDTAEIQSFRVIFADRKSVV